MSAPRIVGLSGHLTLPSRTLWLTQHIVDRVAAATGGEGQVYSVMDDPAGLGQTLERKLAPPKLEAALRDIETCDVLVAVTPVYKGGYAGLFKHMIDLLDMKVLAGRPVIVAATGYSERHACVVDYLMRPLFAFFGAQVMNAGVFAGKTDIGEQYQLAPALEAAIDSAVRQAAHSLGTSQCEAN
ncbi:MAG: hypothetical protein RJA36_2102 [Pseudomonadota bacterium]|jgi:FMN reductase